TFEVPAACADTTISADALCGNGSLGSAEACELNETRVNSCTDAASRAGTRRDTCNSNCSGWVLGTCETGRCGDGVVQAPEVCDDGSLNGTYGHCNATCTAEGPYCGDGDVYGSETCDNGSSNGQYNTSEPALGYCAWNCIGFGPRCGDGVVNGPEACDGNAQSSVGYCDRSYEPCSTSAECPSGETCRSQLSATAPCPPSSDGFPQVHTRTCESLCQFWGTSASTNPWGPCQQQGGCGNGIREGAEECDDGNTNQNDGCIIMTPGMSPNPTNNCATAGCGDGYVRLGVEACDNGAGNGVPCTPSYSGVCNYCSTSCAQITLTGGYCGDGIISLQPEVCDGAMLPPSPPALAQCYPDCAATCPLTYSDLSLSFSRAPALSQFSSTIDVESTTHASCGSNTDCATGFVCVGGRCECNSDSDCSANYECVGGRCTNTYINIPACRLADTSTPLRADLSFANAAWKPLHVVFMFDVSMTTDDVTHPGCGTSLECVKQAVAGPGGAMDQFFDNYPGEVRIGVVKFSLPYPRVPRVVGFTPFAVDVNASTPRYCSGTQELRCTRDVDCSSGETCLLDPAPLDHLAGESSRAALKTKVMDTVTTQGEDDAHLGYEKAQEIFTNYSSTDAEKVLIYVSDGAAVNCPTEAKLEADTLKLAGVKVYTVAFGTDSPWLQSESSECASGESLIAAIYNEPANPPPSSAPSPQTDWCATITNTSIDNTGCPGAGNPKYYHLTTNVADLDDIYGDIIDAIMTADVKVGSAAMTQDVGEGAAKILDANITCNPNAAQQIPFWTTFGGSGTIGVSNTRLRYCP
ncbi:MAG: hypothetical protein AAB562_03825, partial [Patescibacteria group bacterium]